MTTFRRHESIFTARDAQGAGSRLLNPGRTSFTVTVEKELVHTFVGSRNRAKKCEGEPNLMVRPVAIWASQVEAGRYESLGKIRSDVLARPPCAFNMTKSVCSYDISAGGPTGEFAAPVTGWTMGAASR